MNARNLTVCCWLIIMAATICSAKPWRGIVPLKSNRTDVERLLGPSDNKEFARYYLANETVYVEYAPTDEHWNVAPGTVISITVIPKYRVRLTELGINMRKFKKERAARDMVASFLYTNERDGFSIEVVQGIVNRFTYEPTKREYLLYRNRTNKPFRLR